MVISNVKCICMYILVLELSIIKKYPFSIWKKRNLMKTFLQCTECQVLCLEKSVPLPCNFDAYDLNGDKAIAFEEFMSATKGFTIMDRKTLFEAFDKNGKISLQWNTFSYVIVSLRIISRSFRILSGRFRWQFYRGWRV